MTDASAKVCVVGSANLDLTFRMPRLPRSGETLAGEHFHTGFGGKGANQAVMAARLGAGVALVARVGGDVFGEHSMANFRREGIDTSHVVVDPEHATGTAAILVDAAGNNCIIVVAGANASLSPADVRAAASAIQGAQVLLCQLEVPVETSVEAFRLARAAGVMTVLNPAPAMPLPAELLCLTDVCIPNETELEALTGLRVATFDQIATAGRALLEQGPATVIVTLGDRGASLIQKQIVEHFPAEKVTAVDTSGAGDAFIGSLAVFLGRGAPLANAIHKANAVAALSVTRPGTQSAFPTQAELVHFNS